MNREESLRLKNQIAVDASGYYTYSEQRIRVAKCSLCDRFFIASSPEFRKHFEEEMRKSVESMFEKLRANVKFTFPGNDEYE